MKTLPALSSPLRELEERSRQLLQALFSDSSNQLLLLFAQLCSRHRRSLRLRSKALGRSLSKRGRRKQMMMILLNLWMWSVLMARRWRSWFGREGSSALPHSPRWPDSSTLEREHWTVYIKEYKRLFLVDHLVLCL